MWADSDRNYWMTAEEAKEYGMIDTVLIRKPSLTGVDGMDVAQSEGKE